MKLAHFALAALPALVSVGCRSASSLHDARTDADNALDDAGLTPPSAGVAIGVFGSPNADEGVPDPIFFIGCANGGQAAVELFQLQPSGDAVDQGVYLASYSVSGSDVHIQIGSDELICDVDESSPVGSGAPFVYNASVSADENFYYTAQHSFAAHVLNPAVPTMNGLGEWNTDTLVTCPDGS